MWNLNTKYNEAPWTKSCNEKILGQPGTFDFWTLFLAVLLLFGGFRDEASNFLSGLVHSFSEDTPYSHVCSILLIRGLGYLSLSIVQYGIVYSLYELPVWKTKKYCILLCQHGKHPFVSHSPCKLKETYDYSVCLGLSKPPALGTMKNSRGWWLAPSTGDQRNIFSLWLRCGSSYFGISTLVYAQSCY